MAASRTKRLLGSFGLIAFGSIIGFSASEITLAWLMPPPIRWNYPQPLHLPDADLGWVMKPNQKSFTHDKEVVTNALGLRAAAISAKTAAKDTRILCLGDSQTFGNGVAQEDTYPAQLETLLRAQNRDRKIEVVNAGVQGYDTVQEAKLLERLLDPVRPDIVTVGFYLNDILEVEQPKNRYAIDAEKGEFKLTGFFSQFVPYKVIYFLKRSRVVTFLYWKYLIWRMDAEGNITTSILLGKSPAALDRPWVEIERNLRRVQALAQQHNFRLIVFPIPASHEFLRNFPHEQYRSRFIALAAKLGLDTFDPTPGMKALGGGYEKYFVQWDGHINSRTHGFIAQLLAQKIKSKMNGERALSAGVL